MVEKFIEENPKSGPTAYGSASSKTWPQYLAALLGTLVAVALGMHLAWFSAAMLMLGKSSSHIPITQQEGSWIGSLITLGGCFGAIPTGTIANIFGPKRTLQIIALPLLVTWYIIAYTPNVWGLYVARFVAGLGTGAACVAAPMYVAELAEPRIRGTLGTLFQLQITVGFLLGYTFGGTIHDFRLLALLSSSVPIVFLLTFSFMPESPVYLTSKNRLDQARKSLQFLRGKGYDVEEELGRIRETVEAGHQNNGGIADFFKCRATMKALVVTLALMFFQQMSGINAVLFYAKSIFVQSGSSLPSSVCTIIVGAVQVVATYASTLLIDRLGRKILLIISGSVMGLCLGVLGVYFHLQSLKYDLSKASFVPLASIAVYLIVFSMGFGPIPWMISGELFTPKAKGTASSVAATFNWILAFTVTQLFQLVKSVLGMGLTFGGFGVISALGAVFTIFMVPETKGKDLAQVQEMLLGKRRATPQVHTFSDNKATGVV